MAEGVTNSFLDNVLTGSDESFEAGRKLLLTAGRGWRGRASTPKSNERTTERTGVARSMNTLRYASEDRVNEVSAPSGLGKRRGLGGMLMPDPFTGDRPHEWNEWLEVFEMYARVNGWIGSEKADMLAVNLRGKARKVYVDLNAQVRTDYKTLSGELSNRFSHGGTPALASVEFHTRVRKVSESYLDFAIELRRLAKMAFPTLNDSAREKVCIGEYVSRVERKELRLALRHRQFQTVDELVAYSMEWEGIELADMRERNVKQAGVDLVPGTSAEVDSLRREIGRLKVQLGELRERKSMATNRVCTYCSMGGHDARFCRERKRKEVGCWTCQKKGHFSYECPTKPKDPNK